MSLQFHECRLIYITSVQNGRGRTASVDAWVFGMVDTSCTPSLGFMEVVPDRTANTLLPIIQQHVAPETEIWSDQWRAYTQVVHLIISRHIYTLLPSCIHVLSPLKVQTLPNVSSHSTVNHSLHFVDPQTGVHTQNIESYWNRVKYKIKTMKGVLGDKIPEYLDEFMWRERYGTNPDEAFDNICQHMAAMFPPPP